MARYFFKHSYKNTMGECTIHTCAFILLWSYTRISCGILLALGKFRNLHLGVLASEKISVALVPYFFLSCVWSLIGPMLCAFRVLQRHSCM